METYVQGKAAAFLQRMAANGIMLMQDTILGSPGIRFSLGCNDYFVGYRGADEIITQAAFSPGNKAKPEQFAHHE